MAARTSHPILSASAGFDALCSAGDDVDYHEARARDRAAREPFDASAERFIRTPGPAELVRQAADDRMQAGDKAFVVGAVLTFVVTPIGLIAASLLRIHGML